MSNEYLWVEKYRPQKIDDIILSSSLYETFSKIVETGNVSNMLFTGTPGTGKTTVAKAICNHFDLDFIVINGSEDGNIDTLRGKIRQFASSVSFQGENKVVILDSIKDTLAAINNSRFVISNDTGFYHAAGAMSKDSFIIWKDTSLVKNQAPHKNCFFSRKGNWEVDFNKWIENKI